MNNSPVRSTKSTLSDFLIVLQLLVGLRFQILFHSPPGVLFTFPSRYFPLSVIWEYLALEDGPPVFTRGSTCLVLLWIYQGVLPLSPTRLLLSMAGLPSPFG